MHHPFDVCIFAAIKQKLCGKWSNWYLFDDKSSTVYDNMRSPECTTVIQRLSDIWRELSYALTNRLTKLSSFSSASCNRGKHLPTLR